LPRCARSKACGKTTTARYWIEFRDKKRIAAFVLAIALITAFWWVLPVELKKEMSFPMHSRFIASLPGLMFTGWIGGWFTFFFVRAEDLNVVQPFDYRSLCRLVAVLMIAGAVLIAAIFSYSFFL